MKPNRYTYNPPLIIPKLSNFLDIPDSYKRLKVDDKEYLRLRLEKDSQSLVGGGGRVEGGRPVGAESEEQNEEKLIEITSSSSSSSTPSPIENASYFSTRVDEAIDVLLNLAAGPRHSLSPPISTPVNNPPTTETTKTTTTTTTAAVGAAATIEEEDEVEEDEEEKEDEEEDNPHIYKCQLCPKEFHTRKGLSMHEAVHDKKFECNGCGYLAASVLILKQHKETHKDRQDRTIFKCGLCTKQFISRLGYNRHMKINHSNTGHACDQCKHVAYSLSDLTRHKLIHRPIEVRHTFLCTFCPKTFTSRPGLKYHRQWHEANPNEIWGRKKRKKTTKTTKTTMRTTSKKKSLKKKKKKTSTGGGSRSRINKKARLE